MHEKQDEASGEMLFDFVEAVNHLLDDVKSKATVLWRIVFL